MAIYHTLTQKQFLIDGNRHYYWVLGNQEKPALVIFYGYTGVHHDFLDMANSLQDKYFVVIPEFPGWEQSDRLSEPLTIANYTTYFKKLVDYLGLQSITVFGHCVGALVAIEYSVRYSELVDSVFLVSIPYLPGTLSHRFFTVMANLSDKVPRSIRPVFFFWRSRILAVPLDFKIIKLMTFKQKLVRVKSHIIDQPKQPEDSVEEEWISFIRFDFTICTKLNMPVHIIHGSDDEFISQTQVERLLPSFLDTTFDSIPKAGHVPPVESPNALIQLMLRYA